MVAPKLRFKEFEGDWSSQTLGNIAKFISGYAFDSEKFDENGRKLITPKNFTTYGRALFTEQNTKFTIESCDEKFVCRGNDLLILLTDLTQSCELLGKPILLPDLNEEILLNQRILKVEPNQDVIGKLFLLNFFLTENYLKHIKETSTGTTVRHSSHKILSKYEVFYPSKAEQTKIASFLSAVDEKISQLTQKHALLSQYKQGMMQKLFSQQIRFKADDGSEFGEWENYSLKELLLKVIDNRGKTPDTNPELDIPLIEINAIGNRNVNYSKVSKFVSKDTFNSWFRAYLEDKDILFSTVGNTAICSIYSSQVQAGIAQNLVGLRARKEVVESVFLYYLLIVESNNKKFKAIEMQAVQPSIKVSQMIHINFEIPKSLTEQTKIANFLSAIDQKIEVVAQQIEQAKTWKKGLLQQMFV
ncbi:restriction endonuclease subunit S [Acinetobacter indicus]|uniref:restriction endonuclease subunit S n=1 Tax=Acinetobacter indicus TaxID=756892 RepID=UPI000CEC17C4|nr:restriction endonuclease subunit S [Acinetobacter indicus]